MSPKSATDTAKIFLSYSRRDRERVADLGAALEEAEDLTVFRDTEDILPTEEWKPRLEALIRKSDTVVFALSPASVASEVCAWEIDLALSLNKRIIPVVVDDVDGDVPSAISKLNYIFMTARDDFRAGVMKIRDAIHLDIDWIREHTRVAELANRWGQAQRLGAQPLRGRELEAVEQWLMSHPVNAPAPTDEQRAFIRDSRRRAQRRMRIGVSVVVVAFAIVSTLALLAWQQRNQAVASDQAAQEARAVAETEKQQSQKSESRFIARRAMELMDQGATEDALALALRSLPHPDTPNDRPLVHEAELAAIRAYGALNTQNIVEFDQAIETVAFAKDDQWALLGGFRLGMKLFDLTTNRVLHSFEARDPKASKFEASLPIAGGVISVAVHPSDRMVATGGDGVLRFWSLRDGHQYSQVNLRDQAFEKLAFSPDGEQLIAHLQDKRLLRSTIRSWRSFKSLPDKAQAFWISDDSRFLLVQHARPEREIGDDAPLADDVLTTYDLRTLEAISTRSFPYEEARAIALVPGRDAVLVLGKKVNREVKISDLHHEVFFDRPAVIPMKVSFSDAGDKALVRVWQNRAQVLEYVSEPTQVQGQGRWQAVIYPKQTFSLSKPRVHVPEVYGDAIGFWNGEDRIWGMNNDRNELRVHRLASDEDGRPAKLELPLPFGLKDAARNLFHLNGGQFALISGQTFKTMTLQPEAALDQIDLGNGLIRIEAAPQGDYAVALGADAQLLNISTRPGTVGDTVDPLVRGATDPLAPRFQITPYTRDLDKGAAKPFSRIGDVMFSPDGRYVLVESDKPDTMFAVRTYELFDSTTFKRLLSFDGNFPEVAFDPRQDALIVSGWTSLARDGLSRDGTVDREDFDKDARDGLFRLNLKDGSLQQLFEGDPEAVTGLHQSADGARIAVQTHKSIRVLDHEGTALARIDVERIGPVFITPDGRNILHTARVEGQGGKYKIEMYDAESGQLRHKVEGLSYTPDVLRFGKDSQTAFMTDGKNMSRLDVESARLVWTVGNLETSADDLLLSEDGRFVSKRFLERGDALLRTETGEAVWDGVTFAERSNYDTRLTHRYGQKRLWDLSSGLASMDLRHHKALLDAVFLPGKEVMLLYSSDGRVFLSHLWQNSAAISRDAHRKVERLAPLTLDDKCAFNLIALEECL